MKNEESIREHLTIALEKRHAEMKNAWGLPDEVFDGLIGFGENLAENGAETVGRFADLGYLQIYDNLAVNGEIVTDENIAAFDSFKSLDEAKEDAIFHGEGYAVIRVCGW